MGPNYTLTYIVLEIHFKITILYHTDGMIIFMGIIEIVTLQACGFINRIAVTHNKHFDIQVSDVLFYLPVQLIMCFH